MLSGCDIKTTRHHKEPLSWCSEQIHFQQNTFKFSLVPEKRQDPFSKKLIFFIKDRNRDAYSKMQEIRPLILWNYVAAIYYAFLVCYIIILHKVAQNCIDNDKLLKLIWISAKTSYACRHYFKLNPSTNRAKDLVPVCVICHHLSLAWCFDARMTTFRGILNSVLRVGHLILFIGFSADKGLYQKRWKTSIR